MRAHFGDRTMAECSIVSSYAKGLSTKDQENYLRKLTLTTGYRLTDPYSITTGWVEDISKWPTIQWPDIYTYLVEKPSVYTREKLREYKSLDAYNYVVCGHVQNIKYHDIDLEFCVLKADVLPSKSQGHKTAMYKAWVIVNKADNYVFTANCTCMAGLGSCCSHAAAILFKVELCVRMGRTERAAVTSEACVWKDQSRKDVKPAPLSEICFSKPKRLGRQLPAASKPVRELTDDDIRELKAVDPHAVVLTSLEPSNTETASSDSETEE